MFLTVDTLHGKMTFDTLDGLVHSPRYVALFTISFLNKCVFKGDSTDIHAVFQFKCITQLPYAIAVVHFFEQAFKHRIVFTVDDLIFCAIFVMTL